MSKLDDILEQAETDWINQLDERAPIDKTAYNKQQIKDLMIEIAKNTMSQADFIKYVEAL